MGPEEAERAPAQIEIVDYNPHWPRLFELEAARIRTALGSAVGVLEHVGSTSVPGLAAKPVIDIHLVVADSAGEGGYRTSLETAGYQLIIREPEWFQHRMFQGHDPAVNLHVFSNGCDEVKRALQFRDWLRVSLDDVVLYAETKRRLAKNSWTYVQDYADGKQEVIAEIMARAQDWALAGRKRAGD
jgi:GrpB-like predicted nucleotidyltransferase (UPF0157 family)